MATVYSGMRGAPGPRGPRGLRGFTGPEGKGYLDVVSGESTTPASSGSITLTFNKQGAFTVGQRVRVINTPTNYFEGTITAITGSIGTDFDITIQRDYAVGSTPAAGWTMVVAGVPGDGEGGTSGFSGDYDDLTNKPTIPSDISDLTDTENLLGGGSGGLPTVTIPAVPVTLYKGLQASYGVVHSNNNSDELNVNKIVIHKPATTTVTIDPTGSNDAFQVSGLGSSDVLAMFVVYGDVNGAKPLSDLQNFTRSVIDNVILIDGVEGDFRSVDSMKIAFYETYPALVAAANGLYTNFQFYANSTPTLNGGPTTVREGSGAVFEISNVGDGTYFTAGTLNPGTNYRAGHKIKVLGTDLGGVTPDNDCIITVDSVGGDGDVFGWSLSGTAAGSTFTTYSPVSGTNYNVGSGFTVASVTNTGLSVSNNGSNYVLGDVLTLLGENITNGTTPENNITITVIEVGGNGELYNFTISGTRPDVWPTNNINDGGEDQYDTANYINTNLANEINYNDGETVVDGTAEFGAGSTYSFVYDTAIFGLFVTGNGATSISTSGNSGADGGSTTEAGNVFGGGTAEQTFDNAVTHLNLVGDVYAGEEVSFTKTDDGDEVDILIPNDEAGLGVGITRDSNQGIYNPYREGSWDSDVSPGGTLWNIDGWTDFSDVESRTYTPLYETFGFGGLGEKIVGAECVMYLPDNGKYYAVKFSSWTQNANGGGFAYTRRELDLDNLQEGIRFADGTVLKSAEGVGRVKLESPGNRRIEEVYGYKQVSVTSRDRNEITGATYTSVNAYELRVKKTTEINAFISPYYNTDTTATWYISFDNVTFRPATINSDGGDNWMFYYVNANNPTVQVEDAPFYIRRDVGGDPVVWWDSADLPGGSSNFRGAIIKYHAYITDAGTMIGTIHIAKDDGDESVAHTEVLSGGSDGENAVLWYQDNENQLKYQRIDGESSTAKIQWSATVFYGSEYYD